MILDTIKNDIHDVLQQWIESVKTLNPKNVVKHYAEDAVLWGTVSKIIRPGHDLIHEYFVNFLAKNPVECIVKEPQIRIYGDIAINSGYYTFVFDNKGTKVSLDARYSFVFKKHSFRWLIVDHHSSVIPE